MRRVPRWTPYMNAGGRDVPLRVSILESPRRWPKAREHKIDLVIICRGWVASLGRLRTHGNGIIPGSPCPVLSFRARSERSTTTTKSKLGYLTHLPKTRVELVTCSAA
jgi:hypothetical protein